LPLPWERLLQELFMNFQFCVQRALTYIEDMDFLIKNWWEAKGIE
jgi:hypothetical protein